MTPVATLILGLLVGWLVEWVIDWLYWRRRRAALQAELDQAKAAASARTALEGRLGTLKAESATLRQSSTSLEADNSVLKQQLSALTAEKSSLAEQLATLKAESATLRQSSTSLEADRASLKQQLSALTAERSSLTEQLAACQAKLSPGASPQAVEAPAVAAATPTPAVAGPVAPTVRMATSVSTERDDLEIIKGIGPVINRLLNQAGIYTFQQLGAMTPARLREVVGDVIQRLANEESILAQARELAAKKERGG
jgi:predicted flap endonuclease-1-like 5' DNA nuclease